MADSKGELTGLVTDDLSGRPLAGAQVQIGGEAEQTVTGPDGRYTLSLAPNTYTVRVTMLGYNPRSINVVVTAGRTSTQDFVLIHSAIAGDGLSQ